MSDSGGGAGLRLLVPVLLAAIVVAAGWPALHAEWVRDDFCLLALARMIGSPFAPFVQDHFHVPGAMFRPLTYATMWLNQRLLGNTYTGHAAVELALHAGVSLALYALVRRGVRPPGLALAVTLLYAIHPTVISASVWYSDRSGHLATLFILLALNLGYRYRDNPRTATLLPVLAAALTAMLSKDHGVVVVVPITLVWLTGLSRTGRPILPGLLWLWVLVPAYFAWRLAVLGTTGSSLTGPEPIWQVMLRGLQVWFAHLPGYMLFWERLSAVQRGALVVAALLLGAALVRALRRAARAPRNDVRRDLLLSGIVLFFVPGLLQAPVAALNAIPLSAQVSAVETAMQARLYYLSFAGLALMLAVLLGTAWEALQATERRWKAALLAGLTGCVVALGSAGWQTVDAYRIRSVAIAGTAHAALRALESRPLPHTHCRIYFLDVWHSDEWGIYASMDSIIKALAPDLDRVGHCLIRSDYPTFFHYLPAGVFAAERMDRLPPAMGPAGPLLPRRVGAAEIVYLAHPSPPSDGELFLSYESGAYRDVSAEVRSGQRAIRFR
jgi:hypothetical protein